MERTYSFKLKMFYVGDGDYTSTIKSDGEDNNVLYFGKLSSIPYAIINQIDEHPEFLNEWCEDNLGNLAGLIKKCEDNYPEAIFPEGGIIEFYVAEDIDNANHYIALTRIPLVLRDSEKKRVTKEQEVILNG